MLVVLNALILLLSTGGGVTVSTVGLPMPSPHRPGLAGPAGPSAPGPTVLSAHRHQGYHSRGLILVLPLALQRESQIRVSESDLSSKSCSGPDPGR